MLPRLRPLRVIGALLIVAILGAGVACSPAPAPSSLGNRKATPPPEASQPAPGASGPAALERGVMSAAELRVAYQAILDRFVEPVDHTRLLHAAGKGLEEAVVAEAPLPLFTLPLALAPLDRNDAERDWRAFGDAYDATVQKLPAWAAETHADWLVVRQMVESLGDAHSSFLTPEEVRRRAEGTFGGIGVTLARSDQGAGPLVSEVLPGSPAASAGLRRGDRIVAVDGQDLAGKPLSEIVRLIRGQRGTEVRLRIQRYGVPQPVDVRLTRAQVRVDPVVGGVLSGNSSVGYLRIRTFADGSDEAAVQILQLGTQGGARGWILDLRGNTGGSLQAVMRVAGAFLEDQSDIGFEVDRAGQRSRLPAVGPRVVRGGPLVVLIDRDTASGAEILAAALRDHGVAQLVGVKTAGNVGVASLLPLPDGSAVQVTERRFLSSTGAQLDKVGVSPDVAVDLADADLEAGRDPQLQRAGELVAAQLAGR